MSKIAGSKMDVDSAKFGFIGGGNMAKAIALGLIKKGVLKSNQIHVSSPSDSTTESWESLKVHTTHNNGEIIDKCDVIFLAFKPYQLDSALQGLQKVTQSKLYVSVLVGVSCEVIQCKLAKYVQSNARLIRIMPNIALAVEEGCVVMSPDKSATPEDVELVRTMFSSIGTCEEIPERLMEPAAAVAGSGLAYIFMVIEAMADGVVKHGVPRSLALTIAAQTVTGASKLVLETKKHPGQLKDEVCSPGGTTICGVHELERGGLRSAFMNAIEAAVFRARDIKAASHTSV